MLHLHESENIQASRHRGLEIDTIRITRLLSVSREGRNLRSIPRLLLHVTIKGGTNENVFFGPGLVVNNRSEFDITSSLILLGSSIGNNKWEQKEKQEVFA